MRVGASFDLQRGVADAEAIRQCVAG